MAAQDTGSVGTATTLHPDGEPPAGSIRNGGSEPEDRRTLMGYW
jgi:hypothetical protein